ncbi:DNA helicase RecQ [Solirubrum puertoriconensis]|uniref:DNA helicase RecQ n=1 Tax=Solirubrum puertoriconensis TaxID=1751427 RepID=A0A9X0HMG7_SOLP1|nr:DNA helicase RecQ [Solirubrum puertoriconensis]KUG08728.1 ATP-dependent DNA helicase RecQ [Solirubrum puertoriconensis]
MLFATEPLAPSLESARRVLKQYYGYDTFRPMQQDIIQSILGGRDTVVLMPTGGGKSVCFQVPAMVLEGVCVVVSPLIALMKDQVEALKANGIPAACINSSIGQAEQNSIGRACQASALKLLYVSPEKLLSEGFLSFLKRIRVSMFAIDEAHCISSWGHDFRPEYTQLRVLREQFAEVPIIALTATADRLTQRDIQQQLRLNDPQVFLSSFDRPNLSLNVRPGQDRVNNIISYVKQRPTEPGIVYCLSRKQCETLAGKLKEKGFRAGFYHAGMTDRARSEVQEQFLRDDLQVICATVAFGMGIDKSNVRWVIHYNLPKNIEGYYQEIGRGGRDGAAAEAVLFYSYADVAQLRDMITKDADPRLAQLNTTKLERMQQFAEAASCRRRILLAYFGEVLDKDCGNCDICRNPPVTFDGTELAQKALSAVARTREQAPLTLIADVLLGRRNQAVISRGYDQIKTFGAGANLSFLDWQSYLHQLLNDGLLYIAYEQGYALKLTDLGWQVLKGERKQQLKQFQVPAKAEKAPKGRAAKAAAGPRLVSVTDDLFDRLRQLRKRIADQQGVPPYVVFSDTTLQEMAIERPRTRTAMLAISGVGMKKFETYGEQFIQLINEQAGAPSPDDVPDLGEDEVPASPKKRPAAGSTFLDSWKLHRQGLSVEQVAEQRGLSPSTVKSHLETLYEKGYQLRTEEFLTMDDFAQIKMAAQELGPELRLRDLFDHLRERYDYFQLRIALIYDKRMRGELPAQPVEA